MNMMRQIKIHLNIFFFLAVVTVKLIKVAQAVREVQSYKVYRYAVFKRPRLDSSTGGANAQITHINV